MNCTITDDGEADFYYDETGVDFSFVELVDLVVSLNLHRRHLNESQRAMVADRLATMQQGARTDLSQICAKSQDESASLLNVSRRAVQSTRKVRDEGTPELIAEVESGKLAVSKAVHQIETKKKETERQQLAADIAQVETDDRHHVYAGDFRELMDDIGDATVSLIFTDPPYDDPTRIITGDMVN